MIATVFGLVWRVLMTRGRVLLGVGLGAFVMLAGLGVGLTADDQREAFTALVERAALPFLAPVIAVVFSSAAIGDLAEDGTLVYLWLRPVPRWQVALASWAAAATLAAIVVVVSVFGAALAARADPSTIAAVVVASLLAVITYSALAFVLGMRTRRALLWGLAYALVWEGAVAQAAAGLATVSVRRYTVSAFYALADLPPSAFSVGLVPAIVVLTLTTAAALALSPRVLGAMDVA